MTDKQLSRLIKNFESSKKGEREQKLKLNVSECLELIAHYEQANKILADSVLFYKKMTRSDKLELISEYIREEEEPIKPVLAELRKGKNVEDYNPVILQHLCDKLWDINKLWLLIEKEKHKDEEKAAKASIEKKPQRSKHRHADLLFRDDEYPDDWIKPTKKPINNQWKPKKK